MYIKSNHNSSLKVSLLTWLVLSLFNLLHGDLYYERKAVSTAITWSFANQHISNMSQPFWPERYTLL